jgi:hypothetical protein
MRADPEAAAEAVLVLRTLGAPERRRLRGRRGRELVEAGAEPVPTTRVTLIRPDPFGSIEEAEAWLAGLRGDRERADAELEDAGRLLNRALHAHRAAAADPHARDVSTRGALVARIGFGGGEAVADGRFERAWELPPERRRTRRSMEAPEERFAALLGGRARILACEELVLRARADLDAGRVREAALEARVALEALLAELGEDQPAAAGRGAVGDAANAALRGDLPAELERSLAEAIEEMEAALRRRRLGG